MLRGIARCPWCWQSIYLKNRTVPGRPAPLIVIIVPEERRSAIEMIRDIEVPKLRSFALIAGCRNLPCSPLALPHLVWSFGVTDVNLCSVSVHVPDAEQ